LILAASHGKWSPEPINQGLFIDLNSFEMKESKFRYTVGPITDWKNSY
jgi:hypothetical protein